MDKSRRRKRWVYVLGIIATACLAFETYARFPARIAATPLNLDAETMAVILIFHGTRGRNEPTLTALTEQFANAAADAPATTVVKYIWSPYSDNQFRASANAERIGPILGKELARLPRLESIRLIAHSAGAYLLDPLCKAYREAVDRPARIEMTFLDPIGIKGAWDFGYGYRNYGHCADFAQAFINVDDIVPGTNAPLKHAYNFDVTEAEARSRFTGRGHIWPVQFYLDQLGEIDITPGIRNHSAHNRGEVEIL